MRIPHTTRCTEILWPTVFNNHLRCIGAGTRLGHRFAEPVSFLDLYHRESEAWGKVRKRTDPLYLLHLSSNRPLYEENVVEYAQDPVPGTGAVSRF